MSKLKVYWFGYGGSSPLVERLRPLIEEDLGMTLTTIHEHSDADIPWSLETVYPNLSQADIIVIPADYEKRPYKSNNRLTQAMALGKPVICEPMPSYKRIVKNFENAIILNSSSLDEWKLALTVLRDNSKLRNNLSVNALKDSKKYSSEQMAKKWVNFLRKIDNSKIDVIIPTKKNIPIISECLKSFQNSSLEETVYIIDNDCESDDLEKLCKDLGFEVEIRYSEEY